MSSFTAWLQQPFNSQMSAIRWVAWVGLILAAMILWGQVLRLVEEVA